MLARCKQPTDLSSHWLQQGSAKKEGHVKQKGTQTQQSTCVSGVKHNNPKTGLKIQKKCCCEKKEFMMRSGYHMRSEQKSKEK